MNPDSLIVLAIVGLIAQAVRVVLQFLEHGLPEPKDYWKAGAKLFLGAVGGWIAWEIINAPLEAVLTFLPDWISAFVQMGRLFAALMGFAFPDVLENLLVIIDKYFNKGNNDG